MAFSPKTIRQLYIWHKWTGLFAAVFLFIVNFSGAIAVFKEEIDRLVTPAKVVRSASTKVSLDTVIGNVLGAFPGVQISRITLPRRPDAAVEILAVHQGIRTDIFADPYTGGVTGSRSGENLANVIRQTHLRFFFFGFWGRVVVGFFGFVMVVSVITGVLIYGRFMRGIFSQGLRFWSIRKGLQLATSDLHKLVGVVALAFNFLIGVTGAVLGFENLTRYTPGLRQSMHPRPLVKANPAERAAGMTKVSYDAALRTASAALDGFEPSYIVTPVDATSTLVVYGNLRNDFARDGASFVAVNADGTQKVEIQSETRSTRVGWFYNFVEPLHYGYFGGVGLKIGYLLFGFTGAFLSLTGFLLWWYKERKGYPVKRYDGTLDVAVMRKRGTAVRVS